MQSVSQKSGGLLNPGSHSSLCHRPVMKKKTPQILIYQSQSQICIDFKVAGCYIDSHSKNQYLNTIGQMIANKSAGPGCCCLCLWYRAFAEKKFSFEFSGSIEREKNLNRCILNPEESMFACRHTHSTQPCFSSLFYPYTNFPKTKPRLRWIHCPMVIQDFEENSTRIHWAVHYTVKEGPKPWNTSPERLFAMVLGPFPEHNSTNPVLWNGVCRQGWRHQPR